MTIVIEQVALLMIFGLIGYTLAKTGLVSSQHTKVLSTLSVYVFLSCNVFKTFSNNFTPTYLKQNYPLLILSTVILLVMVLFAEVMARTMTKDGYKRNIIRYSLTIPNYSYVGYPLAEGIFGTLMLQNVMVVTIPTSVFTYTVGYCMLTHSKVTFKRLLNPTTIAMVLGAIAGLTGFQLPSVMTQVVYKSAACMAPIGMLLAGAVIAEYSVKTLAKKKEVYLIAALRLIATPLVLGGALLLLGLKAYMVPLMLIFSMPCGLNTIVFPKLIGEDCETGAALALLTNLACCITIPVIFWLFGIMG